MKKLTLTVLAVGFAAALQPFANAQFGSGIVFDPTQSGHAIVQIEHEEQSIANQAQQIEQGPTDFHEYREDRHDGATSLQRRKAAIRAHASDDSRSTDALCAISVSDF